MVSSQLASHHVLDECILEDVAKQAWTKELLTKFQKPYLAHWTKGYSTHMYHLKPDEKADDDQLTPRQ